MYHNPNDLRHDDANVREAVRFGLLMAVLGVAFLVVAAVWVSTCDGATADTVACGAPQRTLLALGAPVILLIGGLRAFVRTYQTWQRHETWWAWQGAGWFLMTLMLLVLTMSLPTLAGSAGEGACVVTNIRPTSDVRFPDNGFGSTVEISPGITGRGMGERSNHERP